MNEFLNENWKDVYNSVSPPIFDGFGQVVSTIINNIADFLPFDALFPETIPRTDMRSSNTGVGN